MRLHFWGEYLNVHYSGIIHVVLKMLCRKQNLGVSKKNWEWKKALGISEAGRSV